MEIAYQLKLLVLRQKWKCHVLLQFEVTTTKTNIAYLCFKLVLMFKTFHLNQVIKLLLNAL